MSSSSSNNNDKSNGASVMTAQDRKRRILERRRASLQRSISVPTNLGSPNYKHKKSSEASMFSHIGRHQSMHESSRSNLHSDEDEPHSQSTVQTRLFSTGDSQSAFTNNATATSTSQFPANETSSKHQFKSAASSSRSSLFGSVMQRTASTPGSVFETVNTTPHKGLKRHATEPTTPSQRMAKHLASPGGYGLLQMINIASPYVDKTQTSWAEKTQSSQEKSEWQDAPLDKIVDWTVKPKLRLECIPTTCLPTMDAEGVDEWNKALQYWQYLAENDENHAPSKLLQGDDDKSFVSSNDAALAKKLVQTVRGRNAHIHQMAFSPLRQWQVAFNGLHRQWMHRLDRGDADAYFYASTSQTTILFRGTVRAEGEVLPMICLSSTSRELRESLISREVTLYVLGSRQVFDEHTYDPKPDDIESADLQEVKTDMEALRKAQVFGATAGADVSIKAKVIKRLRPADIPPLCILGHDDCSAFSTWFLNRQTTLPTLQSRMGAFPNATQKSLVIAKQRVASEHAFVELTGPILPCCVPALAHVTAETMLRNKAKSKTDGLAAANDDDAGLGSHYFVLQAEEDLDAHHPVVLNGTSSDACRCASKVDVVVWDISRPGVMTYKIAPT